MPPPPPALATTPCRRPPKARRPGHERGDVVLDGDVGDDVLDAAADRARPSSATVDQARLGASADRDRRAVGRQPPGAGGADAGAAAGDDDATCPRAQRDEPEKSTWPVVMAALKPPSATRSWPLT